MNTYEAALISPGVWGVRILVDGNHCGFTGERFWTEASAIWRAYELTRNEEEVTRNGP